MLLQPITGFSIHRGNRLCLIVWSKNSSITIDQVIHSHTHTHARMQARSHICTKMREPSLLWHLVHFACKTTEVLLSLSIDTLCCQQTLREPETSMKRCGKQAGIFFTSSVSPLCLKILWPKFYLKHQWVAAKTWHPPLSLVFPLVVSDIL